MFSSTARTSLKRVPTRVRTPGSFRPPSALSQCPRRHYSAILQQDAEPAPEPLTNLRSNPFTFPPDTGFQQTQTRTTVGRYNEKIYAAYRRRAIIECFTLAADMKRDGVAPNLDTYTHLISAAWRASSVLDCFAIYEDMLAAGIEPTLSIYNILLQAAEENAQVLFVLDAMKQRNIQPTADTYEILVEPCLRDDAIEMALTYIWEMQRKGIQPTLVTMENTIKAMARLGNIRLAMDMVHAFEVNSVRALGPEVWVTCLEAAADALWPEGVTECWDKVTDKFLIQPTEGVCLSVLTTTARHAMPQLAASAIEQLARSHIPMKVHHFIPFIAALCKGNGLKPAIQALVYVRPYGVEPTARMVEPILDELKQNVDALDGAWTLLDEMLEAGEVVEPVVMNAMVEAAVILEDLPRAMGAYKSFADFNVIPNRDTFSLLLRGAIDASHRQLGDVIVTNMKELGINPDATTYAQIIELCLTQETYLDAFTYLEEMKAALFVPSAQTYTSLAMKCAQAGDTRWQMVVEEMQELGYPVRKPFRTEMESLMNRALIIQGAAAAANPVEGS